jgi:hypothetical protein
LLTKLNFSTKKIGKKLEADAWQKMIAYILKTFVGLSPVFVHRRRQTHTRAHPCLEVSVAGTPIVEICYFSVQLIYFEETRLQFGDINNSTGSPKG